MSKIYIFEKILTVKETVGIILGNICKTFEKILGSVKLLKNFWNTW